MEVMQELQQRQKEQREGELRWGKLSEEGRGVNQVRKRGVKPTEKERA